MKSWGEFSHHGIATRLETKLFVYKYYCKFSPQDCKFSFQDQQLANRASLIAEALHPSGLQGKRVFSYSPQSFFKAWDNLLGANYPYHVSRVERISRYLATGCTGDHDLSGLGDRMDAPNKVLCSRRFDSKRSLFHGVLLAHQLVLQVLPMVSSRLQQFSETDLVEAGRRARHYFRAFMNFAGDQSERLLWCTDEFSADASALQRLDSPRDSLLVG